MVLKPSDEVVKNVGRYRQDLGLILEVQAAMLDFFGAIQRAGGGEIDVIDPRNANNEKRNQK